VNGLARLFDPRADWLLIGGIINGHVTWSLQLLINYLLDAAACDAAAAGATQLGGYELAMVVVTFVMAAITSVFLVACIRVLRFVRGGRLAVYDDERRRRTFMAAAGAALSGLFVLVIVFGGSLHLVLAPCIRG
jgi:hypothetical protein